MSNLVLRAGLSRPLTHNELDANMQFLEIVEWSAKDFRAGQFAYRIVSNVTSLYLCVETHTQFVYEITDGAFAETITIDDTVTRLWRKVAGGGGGGTGAEFVAAEFDSDTNILTFTTADGDPVPIDLSSLAGGGGTGSSGTSGASGSSGSSGITGSSGSSGITGSSGLSGTSGLSGDKYKTTSDTSHTLGSSGTITVDTGLSYSVAQSIIIAYNASNFQESEVVSYNSGTGVLVFGAPTRTVGSGTYTSWTVNLDGATGGNGTSGTSGAKGTSGVSGNNGTSGVNGTSGANGNNGSSGSSGAAGAAGSSGSSGAAGSSGSSGAAGASGSSGTSGARGTSGSSGVSGTSGESDNYLGTVLAPIDYSTLVVGTPLIVTTTPALSYSAGQTVVIAYDGSNYVNGNVLTYNDISGQLAVTILNVVWGTSGNLTPSQSNLQGLSGASGSSGSSGTAGSSGVTGSSGSSGASGSSGTSGARGTSGTAGSSGLTGTSGANGTSGINGTSGATGATGSSGSSGQTGATGTSGSSASAGSSGAAGAAGANGTSGTSAAGGGSGVYFVKLQYASGSLAAAPGCFVSAQDPSGGNLLSTSGWVFTRVGANEITITHPEAKFAINAMTHAENTTGNYLSKAVSGASTGVNSLIQAISTKDSMNFKALSGTQTGLNTGAGPYYMYVTWTFPDNDFAI